MHHLFDDNIFWIFSRLYNRRTFNFFKMLTLTGLQHCLWWRGFLFYVRYGVLFYFFVPALPSGMWLTQAIKTFLEDNDKNFPELQEFKLSGEVWDALQIIQEILKVSDLARIYVKSYLDIVCRFHMLFNSICLMKKHLPSATPCPHLKP